MLRRKLRFVKLGDPAMAVCERCNAQFTGKASEIGAQFKVHKCKLTDSSQNALRIVREATEDK